jgi:hypothetical protein
LRHLDDLAGVVGDPELLADRLGPDLEVLGVGEGDLLHHLVEGVADLERWALADEHCRVGVGCLGGQGADAALDARGDGQL